MPTDWYGRPYVLQLIKQEKDRLAKGRLSPDGNPPVGKKRKVSSDTVLDHAFACNNAAAGPSKSPIPHSHAQVSDSVRNEARPAGNVNDGESEAPSSSPIEIPPGTSLPRHVLWY